MRQRNVVFMYLTDGRQVVAYVKRQCKNKGCQRTFSTQDARKVYCTRQCGSNWRGRKHHAKNMRIIRASRRGPVVTA